MCDLRVQSTHGYKNPAVCVQYAQSIKKALLNVILTDCYE